MLNFKLIAKAAAGVIAIAVLAVPAWASEVQLQENGASGLLEGVIEGDILILDNYWRVETDEIADAWAWTIECAGCTILDVNMNFAFGAEPGNPSTPGNVLWQAPSYAVIQPTLPGYANEGSYAGSIGGANPGGAFTGNGLDVLVAWVTVHVTDVGDGSVNPYFRPQDGLYGGGLLHESITLTGVFWDAPEPAFAMLQVAALASVVMVYRRRR